MTFFWNFWHEPASALTVLAACVVGHFFAYFGNVALRLAVQKWQTWKFEQAKRTLRRCLCGQRYNPYDMRAHIIDKHPDFGQLEATRIMKRFQEDELC